MEMTTGGEVESTGETDPTPAPETGDATEVGPEDPLEVCRRLPEASTWVEGEPITSNAESTAERIAAVGERTWPLALQLLRLVPIAESPSVGVSPASMYAAMGLSYGRWQSGQCGDRIAAVMAFPELGDPIHPTIGASLRELEGRSLAKDDDVDAVTVSLHQSVWSFGTDTLAPVSSLGQLYGATQNAFSAPSAAARTVINCVIEAQSNGLIPEFLPIGQPAGDTSSYDINVSFLQAPWETALDERTLPFTFVDGSKAAEVAGFGSRLASVQLYESEAFTAVELALRGGDLRFMAIVPPADDVDGIAAFVETLTPEVLATAREEARSAYVDLTIPKVQIASKTINFYDRLKFECEPFTLRSVLHGAAVEIDAKGIKAAAATVNEGWNDSGEPEPELEITIDRPFVFFVYDQTTQYVLYSGRYAPFQGG